MPCNFRNHQGDSLDAHSKEESLPTGRAFPGLGSDTNEVGELERPLKANESWWDAVNAWMQRHHPAGVPLQEVPPWELIPLPTSHSSFLEVFSSSLSPLVFQKSRRRNEWLRGNSHAKPKTVSTKLTRGLGATTCAGKLEGAQLFNQKYTLAWEISSVGGFAQFSDIDSPPFFKSRPYF